MQAREWTCRCRRGHSNAVGDRRPLPSVPAGLLRSARYFRAAACRGGPSGSDQLVPGGRRGRPSLGGAEMTRITAQMSVSLDGYYAGPRSSTDPHDMAAWLEGPEG